MSERELLLDAREDVALIRAALVLMPWSGDGRREAKADGLAALDRLETLLTSGRSDEAA